MSKIEDNDKMWQWKSTHIHTKQNNIKIKNKRKLFLFVKAFQCFIKFSDFSGLKIFLDAIWFSISNYMDLRKFIILNIKNLFEIQ